MKFFILHSSFIPRRAFTLVETLVAVAILTIAMVGPYTVAKHSLDASNIARDELTASSLAQEGIEYARSVRDGNYLYNLQNPGSPRSWLYGLDGSGGSANCVSSACSVDPAQIFSLALVACGASCTPLYLTSSGQYTQVQSGNTATAFVRTVQVSSVSATEVIVRSTVTWSEKGVTQSAKVEDHLTNWL